MSENKEELKRGFAALKAGYVMSSHKFAPRPLGPLDIAVDVTHCGICHSDLHKINDEWVEAGADPSNFPMIPGHEVVGHIVALGDAVDRNTFHIGDRVGFGPERGSCFQCQWCKEGDEQLCDKFEGLYDPETGGYAEHIRVDSRFAFHIPDGIDSAVAAPLLCAGVTTYAPLAYYKPAPGSRVAVVGVGGLGHLALQFSRAMGYHTVAITRQANKHEDAKRFGAHECIVSSSDEEMNKNKNSLDFIMVSASASLDWAKYLDLLRPNGKLCLLGIPSEPLTIPAFKIVARRRTVCGSIIGGSKLMKEMLQFAAEHKVFPQIEVVSVGMNDAEKVNQAIQKVLKEEVRYRMVLQFNTSA